MILVCNAAWLLLVACGEPASEPAPAATVCPEGKMLCREACVPRVTPDVASIHQEIVFRGCAGSNSCHAGDNPKERLDLTTEESLMAMVGTDSVQKPGVKLVEPFHPELSYFLSKLEGENMAPSSGTGGASVQMPMGASRGLCPEKVDVIKQWILNGAQ